MQEKLFLWRQGGEHGSESNGSGEGLWLREQVSQFRRGFGGFGEEGGEACGAAAGVTAAEAGVNPGGGDSSRSVPDAVTWSRFCRISFYRR